MVSAENIVPFATLRSPDHHFLVVEQQVRQRLGQFRLADARGAQKEEGGAAVAGSQAGARAQHLHARDGNR